jgi:hypothetical protein
LPALFYQQAAAWTGPIWIFLLLLDTRHGRVPRFEWFHWLLVAVLGVVAVFMTASSTGAAIGYASVEALAPLSPVTVSLARPGIAV